MNSSTTVAILSLLFLTYIRQHSNACTPGPSSKTSSHHPRLTTPLKLKQRVPDISEQTLGASGAAEGRIVRGSQKFQNVLVENTNSDIQFKDEEGTGADRLMTQRCKDKLNTLAISVMNTWDGVQLRVIEAWDEDGLHEENSLHYEGRAVEITTSDRDKSKYGQLARLAVDAGFDWVSYHSKNFVHCSVQSESSVAATKGGCFHVDSKVTLATGRDKSLLGLLVGDSVMVVHNDGSIGYSPILLIMDRRPQQETIFRVIHTDTDESSLVLTPEHLVYVSDQNATFAESKAVFGKDVQVGQYLYVHRQGDDSVTSRLITGVAYERYIGAIAPLTEQGSILVDGIAASTYAVIRDEWIAHLAFTPIRLAKRFNSIRWFESQENEDTNQTFIHWYPKYLYNYGGYIVQSRLFDGFVLPD